MRIIITFFCTFFISAIAWGQQENAPDRDVSLTILNNRGRPVRNIVMQSLISGQVGTTDRSGLLIFKNLSDNDSIFVTLTKNSLIKIPVKGMDSIIVMAKTSKLYTYIDNQGYNTHVEIIESTENSATVLDVQEILRNESYNSLLDLLQGRVSGLNIIIGENQRTSANMRGPNSFYGSSEPIVVMDGVDIGTVSAANSIVSIYTIKTIEVQRNASQFGVRGANGAIIINTR